MIFDKLLLDPIVQNGRKEVKESFYKEWDPSEDKLIFLVQQ